MLYCNVLRCALLFCVEVDFIVVVLIERSSVIVLSGYDCVTVLCEETNKSYCLELCAAIVQPNGSNVVVLDSEQVKMCSGNDEVTTMVFE